MKVIQNVAEEYNVKDIIFYGSRVLGRQTEASDYDLACCSESLLHLMKKYRYIYPADYTIEKILKLTLEDAGRELTYLLNANISLTFEDTLVELYDNSIRQYHVPLIINDKRLTEKELKTRIIELRSRDIPDQKKREEPQQEFFLWTHVAALSTILRFAEDFKTVKDFIKPKSMYVQQ